MKRNLIFILFTSIIVVSYSQHSVFQVTNFEDDFSFIEFDPPIGNIWQVGTPSKEFLDSAYSVPYALMTDTINMLYEPGKHSFIMKIERPLWGNCLAYWGIIFYQKYSFDSIYSGGYVEISYDKGETWTNFVYDDYYDGVYAYSVNMYDSTDTLFNGIPGISGSFSWGIYPTEIAKGFGSPPDINTHSVWVKFTYINLYSDNNHEGWLIDNLQYEVQVWSEEIDVIDLISKGSFSLYPNPFYNSLTIENNSHNKCYFIKIMSIDGRILYKSNCICKNIEELCFDQFPSGIYFYFISNDNKIIDSGRIIKQ